jgi:hypothetical protein
MIVACFTLSSSSLEESSVGSAAPTVASISWGRVLKSTALAGWSGNSRQGMVRFTACARIHLNMIVINGVTAPCIASTLPTELHVTL